VNEESPRVSEETQPPEIWLPSLSSDSGESDTGDESGSEDFASSTLSAESDSEPGEGLRRGKEQKAEERTSAYVHVLAGSLCATGPLEKGSAGMVRVARSISEPRGEQLSPLLAYQSSFPEGIFGGAVQHEVLLHWIREHLRVSEAEASRRLAGVPINERGELTSVGSASHRSGQCKPCAYWFKGACSHGILCRHCHFIHAGQKFKRLRPSKQRRQRRDVADKSASSSLVPA